MTVSKAKAEWKGNLREGTGRFALGTGLFEGSYSFKTRTEGGRSETTPEELIAQVATKGGTTEAGLKALSENHVTEILAGAVSAAVRRAREIREENDGCTR